ncbi:MAG TPA: Crp/Fnr family transcriptional regulator [Streptosporangiaceae bacterium]
MWRLLGHPEAGDRQPAASEVVQVEALDGEHGGPYDGIMTKWPESSFLAGVPASSRTELLHLGTSRVYEPRHRLVDEGDESTFVVLLCAGCVKIEGRLEDGRQSLLAIRARGDLVGEMAAFDGGPRSATVVCAGRVAANIIPRGDFLRLLRTRADVSLAVNRMLVARLRQANRRRLDFTGCEAPVRVARVLVEISEMYGRATPQGLRSTVSLAQRELAALSGTSRETVEQTLRRLRKDGAVTTSYRLFTVTNRQALHDAAHLGP